MRYLIGGIGPVVWGPDEEGCLAAPIGGVLRTVIKTKMSEGSRPFALGEDEDG